MKVFITGDKHSQFSKMLYNLDGLLNGDTMIIVLGDAGVNFWLNKKDDRLKQELNSVGYLWYLIHGNHEARPEDIEGMHLIDDPNVQGEVWIEDAYPNIRYFKMFGEYVINGYKVAVIGGAYSVDKWYRLARAGVVDKEDPNYYNPKKTFWFPNEQLTTEEMNEAAALFEGKHYDFLFSHTCPLRYQPTDLFLGAVDQESVDNSMECWMDWLKDQFKWNIWCWGHYHQDRIERPHCEMYYNDIEELDAIIERWKCYDESNKLDWWLQKGPMFYSK